MDDELVPKLRRLTVDELLHVENIPEFADFITDIDDSLMREINQFDGMREWYAYFDSEQKPLNPREFLSFWSSLTSEEQFIFQVYTPKELKLKGT